MGPVNAKAVPAAQPAEASRLSGSEGATRGRGLVHLVAFLVVRLGGALLVWRDGAGGGVGVYAVALAGLSGATASYHLYAWVRRKRRILGQDVPLFLGARLGLERTSIGSPFGGSACVRA
jgi:hypothetical protein